jgi:uncharacterized PurR-regulated membrane protein YhhQ (DUF165 family)
VPGRSPDPLAEDALQRRRLYVLLALAGLFLGTLAMLNLLGISRFLLLGSWAEDGFRLAELPPPGVDVWVFAVAVGVLPYPITFLCTDLISEFYGRKTASYLVWLGLGLNLWVIAILWLGGVMPGFGELDAVTGYPPRPEWDPAEQAYRETGWTFFQVRHLAFGAVAASMIAYFVAQFVDVQVFHLWKRLTRGRHLWLRNNASTLVSQFVDTFAVITITHFYAAALPVIDDRPIWPQLWLFIGTGYAFKALVALIDTPLIYLAVAVLRRYLRIDPIASHAGPPGPAPAL